MKQPPSTIAELKFMVAVPLITVPPLPQDVNVSVTTLAAFVPEMHPVDADPGRTKAYEVTEVGE